VCVCVCVCVCVWCYMYSRMRVALFFERGIYSIFLCFAGPCYWCYIRENTFGPVMSILEFSDVDDGIKRATGLCMYIHMSRIGSSHYPLHSMHACMHVCMYHTYVCMYFTVQCHEESSQSFSKMSKNQLLRFVCNPFKVCLPKNSNLKLPAFSVFRC